MQSGLYREEAVKQLSSPEELDQVVRVTSPRTWLYLTALTAVLIAGLLWGFTGSIPRTVTGQGILARRGGVPWVVATTPGVVAEVSLGSGDAVQQGQTVALLQGAGGTPPGSDRIPVASPYTGKVLELLARPGSLLAAGDPVISVDFPQQQLEVHLFVPVASGKQVRPGMPVQVTPVTVEAEQYGTLVGQVRSVSEFPVSARGLMQLLGNEELVRQFLAPGPTLEVVVELQPDAATPSGYRWSSPQGPPVAVSPGTPASGAVVVSRVRPAELILPGAAGR